jgi:hypothetical protein
MALFQQLCIYNAVAVGPIQPEQHGLLDLQLVALHCACERRPLLCSTVSSSICAFPLTRLHWRVWRVCR